MITAISGTPGIGKTSVAKILAKKMNASYISLSVLVKEKKVRSIYDKKRKTCAVSVSDLQEAASRKIKKSRKNIIKNVIIDGHLSHLLKADVAVILRCNPAELRKRMAKKRWSEAKMRENLIAEILGAASIEAMEKYGKSKVVEIDTSKKTPAEAAALIEEILNNHARRKKYAPRIDWTEKYMKDLIKYGEK